MNQSAPETTVDDTTTDDEATRGPHSQRSRYFVSWNIQGRLLARVAGYWTVYHAVLLGAMFLYRYMRYRGELLAGAAPQTFLQLLSEFAAHHYSLVVCAVFMLPLVLWDGVRSTHRVAGPLVRFQNALRALARGEHVAPIALRDGDMLIELQEAFNEYLATLPAPVPVESPDERSVDRAFPANLCDTEDDPEVFEGIDPAILWGTPTLLQSITDSSGTLDARMLLGEPTE